MSKLGNVKISIHLIPLSDDEMFSLSLSFPHIHTKALASGAQPRSVVETKHWGVLTGCDPCFRVERYQKPIDGSHLEGDVYRKIVLAGTLILDSKHWYQMVPQVIMKRVWWRISPHYTHISIQTGFSSL